MSVQAALFYQKLTKEDMCPECGQYLNIKGEDGKVYRFCLTCGHQHEIWIGWKTKTEGRKDEQ